MAFREVNVEIHKRVCKINEAYVGNDCLQIMEKYKDGITIISPEGVTYHHKINSPFEVNKYVDDERRFQFPYSNIIRHFEKKAWRKTGYLANQLFDFCKPYLIVKDGVLCQSYAVKDNDEAYILDVFPTKITPNWKILSRKELENLLVRTNAEESMYSLDIDGTIQAPVGSNGTLQLPINANEIKPYDDPKFILPSEYELEEKFQKQEYVCPIFDKRLIVCVDGRTVRVKMLSTTFVDYDEYEVAIADVPFSESYTLEQVKYGAQKVVSLAEPKIRLRQNPAVSMNELERGKAFVKK